MDYLEAFVNSVELVAHRITCKKCVVATLGEFKSDCAELQILNQISQNAYLALPPDYKVRYDKAAKVVIDRANNITRNI